LIVRPELEHLLAQVGEREGRVRLHVRGIVAASRSELEDRLRSLADRLGEHVERVPGIERVVLGRRQQVEPRREVRVERVLNVVG